MSEKQVELNEHHVKAVRAVLKTSDHITDEVEEQLPEENQDVTLELNEDKHVEMLGHILEGYEWVVDGELPEGREYRADFDVVRDVKSRVTD